MLFLVNLDSATARRARMERQLARLELPFLRIGVDMRGRTTGEIDDWLRVHLPGISFDHRRVSTAEIGCWASHLVAWQSLAALGERACTVLEDDLVLDDALPEAIGHLAAAPQHDIVFLGTSCRNVSTRHRTGTGRFALHRPLGTIYNTWGYVIARAWAQRFFAQAAWRIDRPIDHYTGGSRARALKPRTAVLRPVVVREDPEHGPHSQIEPYTFRIDRARIVERARRRILASRASELYYRLYRFL